MSNHYGFHTMMVCQPFVANYLELNICTNSYFRLSIPVQHKWTMPTHRARSLPRCHCRIGIPIRGRSFNLHHHRGNSGTYGIAAVHLLPPCQPWSNLYNYLCCFSLEHLVRYKLWSYWVLKSVILSFFKVSPCSLGLASERPCGCVR